MKMMLKRVWKVRSRQKGKSTGKCVAPFQIEFRLKVAKLREEEGYPACLLAEQFGISQDSIYRWAKRYRLHGQRGLVNQARGKLVAKTPAAVTQSIWTPLILNTPVLMNVRSVHCMKASLSSKTPI